MSDVQTPAFLPADSGVEIPAYLAGFKEDIHRIVEALMTGADTLTKLAIRLGIDPDDPSAVQDLKNILMSPDVQNTIRLAQRDASAYVVDRFKRDAALYADVVKQIAMDPKASHKARLAAAQDALNRAGTAATQKMSIDSPQAYAERLKDLMEVEEEEK